MPLRWSWSVSVSFVVVSAMPDLLMDHGTRLGAVDRRSLRATSAPDHGGRGATTTWQSGRTMADGHGGGPAASGPIEPHDVEGGQMPAEQRMERMLKSVEHVFDWFGNGAYSRH